MALNFTSKKAPSSTSGAVLTLEDTPPVVAESKVAVESSTETGLEALTKEFILLHTFCEEQGVKTILKRMDEIRKFLVKTANETMDETKPATFKCEAGEVQFSPRHTITTVPNPMALLHELTVKFGAEVAYSVVEIALTPVRQMLSDVELTPYVKKVPGHRVIEDVRPA